LGAFIFTSELFPTRIGSIALGFTSTFGSLGIQIKFYDKILIFFFFFFKFEKFHNKKVKIFNIMKIKYIN
jgi:hypothetical protein